MRGNMHVRFLGEEMAARPSPYPTDGVGSIPITRSTSPTFFILEHQSCFTSVRTAYAGRLRLFL
jgi:hypothetical protein